jgi:tellurium resistance protein TerD
MGIDLSKGGRISLAKEAPGLKRVRVGLAWDANQYSTGGAYDLDASAFVCKYDAAGNPKLINDSYFLFYGNHTTPDGAVNHTGDNRTGDAAGDDESILIDLAALNPEASEISFIVTIHEAEAKKQNFGQVTKSKIALYNDETGEEIAHYNLEDDFSTETAVQFGSLYKKDGTWMFKAVGMGFRKGLADFVVAYGGNLA